MQKLCGRKCLCKKRNWKEIAKARESNLRLREAVEGLNENILDFHAVYRRLGKGNGSWRLSEKTKSSTCHPGWSRELLCLQYIKSLERAAKGRCGQSTNQETRGFRSTAAGPLGLEV